MARTENTITYVPGEKFSLKDHLFNKDKVTMLVECIHAVHSDFDHKAFTKQVLAEFPHLELKQRIAHITDCLYTSLPQDYPQALGILLDALPAPLDPTRTDDDFGDFIYEPINTYIARYGCTREYLEMSLDALEHTTQRFSSEFAIRDFLKKFEAQTLARIVEWSCHDNYHVRRLCSEGTRPSLPWGGKIDLDPTDTIAILDNLYIDPTRYVTRSVANHLNDLSKTRLSLVLETLERWQDTGKQNEVEMRFITRHALRTAIKDGSRKVMDFLGYKQGIKHSLIGLEYKTSLHVGETQEFGCILEARESGGYMVDYIVHFVTKNGGTSTKTMKLKDLTLEKGEIVQIKKRYPFRPASTRTLYPGTHTIEIQINGLVVAQFQFDLKA